MLHIPHTVWASAGAATACGLGESPLWHRPSGDLIWLDIPGRTALRGTPNAQGELHNVKRWALLEEPGCLAPAQSVEGIETGFVLALRSGVFHAPTWGGALQRLADAPYDTSNQRFNDGKADAVGRFWVGGYCEQKQTPEAHLFCYELHSCSRTIHGVFGPFFSSNGLAFDGPNTWWADTAGHRLTQLPTPALPERVQGERVVAAFPAKPSGWAWKAPQDSSYAGRPDGGCVSAEGLYFSAMFEGARVLAWSRSGQLLAQIDLPAACPTMPCLMGNKLYVTTASKGRPEAELRDWPLSGHVLVMDLTHLAGLGPITAVPADAVRV